MPKFYGRIGYVTTEEVRPSVYMEQATERTYKGDLNRIARKLQDGTSVNSSITISNEISIVADPYAREHFHEIRYAVYNNSKWAVTNVEVAYPRLKLTLGGIYNGPPTDRT